MLFNCPPTRRLLKSLFAYDFSVLSHSSKNKSLRWILFHPEKEMNPHFFCIFSSAASWLSVFLTASNSSFIILCFCSHTRWYFYPWNSRRVTPNARLPTSDAKRNFQQSFFFLCIFNPMLAADVSGFFRNQAATNSHSVRSVHCFQQKAAMVPLLLFRLLKVKVFFLTWMWDRDPGVVSQQVKLL